MPEKAERSDDGDEQAEVLIHAHYDWETTDPSSAVVETVADALDREVTAGKPLYEFIDPDALDGLFRSNHSADTTNITLSFIFAGQHVTVHSRGDVIVQSN